MAGVVFPSMEAYGNMAKAVAAVNRGGMEHPFHRRNLPLGSTPNAVFFKIGDPASDVYGDRDGGGVKDRAMALEILEFDVNGNPTKFVPGDQEKEILFTNSRGIFFRNDIVACLQVTPDSGDDEIWIVIQDGMQVFQNCVTIDDIDPTGDVALTQAGSGAPTVDCMQPVSGEGVPAGTDCTVRWDWRTATFQIDGIGCPALLT